MTRVGGALWGRFLGMGGIARARAAWSHREVPRVVAAAGATMITGPTSGIGRALAEQVAASERPLLLACRDGERGAQLATRLRAGDPGGGAAAIDVEVVDLDLTSLAAVVACVDRLVARGARVDRLVCNAGIHVPWRTVVTDDGVELHQQVNCSAHLLLILLLHARGVLGPGAQVLYVGSEAHRMARLPVGYWRAYARSKEDATAALLLLARMLDGVDVRVLSPGTVATDVHRHKPWLARLVSRAIKRYLAPAEAAAALLTAAGQPPPADGGPAYYHRGRRRGRRGAR
jgi:NAD(P)-dependent dehydrogenase (short-subunit alcohol dehydrogenase family)